MQRTIFATAAFASAAAAPPHPFGKLPDTAKPTVYRLDFVVDPAKPGFIGHTEIDASPYVALRRRHSLPGAHELPEASILVGRRPDEALFGR